MSAEYIDVVTLVSKTQQPLLCPVEAAAAVQWRSSGEDIVSLFSYVVSTGEVYKETNDPKYDNFIYRADGTNFDLIILNVDTNDGGVYQCFRMPGNPLEYRLTVEGNSTTQTTSFIILYVTI